MTHYIDLTPYEYDYDESIDESMGRPLNVGWLSAGQPFAQGDAPSGFLDALVRCAFRPVSLFRGYHTCDLCPENEQSDDFMRYSFSGREVYLGNGEIRVSGSSSIVYAAPTLVVHYVEAHRYLPPEPFVASVLERARHIHVVHGAELIAVKRLTFLQRFELCLRALEAVSSRLSDEWGSHALGVLRAAGVGLVMPPDPAHRPYILAMENFVFDSRSRSDGAPDSVRNIALATAQFFVALRFPEPQRDERTLEHTAHILEIAHDVGVTVD